MKVLLLVDIQNDFCAGGSLAVAEGDQITDPVNQLMRSGEYDLIVASKDWHPANHRSFAEHHPGAKPFDQGNVGGIEQTLWPTHCVQGTPGAELHPKLDASLIDRIVVKGEDPEIDSYSAFYDNGRKRETGLREILLEEALSRGLRGLTDVSVDVCGLALDVCVAATARDANELGINTTVVVDGSRAVNLTPGDDVRVLQDLTQAGVEITSSDQILPAPERSIRPEAGRENPLQP